MTDEYQMLVARLTKITAAHIKRMDEGGPKGLEGYLLSVGSSRASLTQLSRARKEAAKIKLSSRKPRPPRPARSFPLLEWRAP